MSCRPKCKEEPVIVIYDATPDSYAEVTLEVNGRILASTVVPGLITLLKGFNFHLYFHEQLHRKC